MNGERTQDIAKSIPMKPQTFRTAYRKRGGKVPQKSPSLSWLADLQTLKEGFEAGETAEDLSISFGMEVEDFKKRYNGADGTLLPEYFQ